MRVAGLGLKTDDVKTALAQGKAILYAFVSINLITGLFAFIMVQLPFGETPPRSHSVRARWPWTCAECAMWATDPPELAVGLAVFCAMPTTLSSGAVLVDQVRFRSTAAIAWRLERGCPGLAEKGFAFRLTET